MYTVKTPEYELLLQSCYNAKQPLFVQGGPGIGKSAIPRQLFKKTAEKEGRLFVEWSDLTLEDRKTCIEKPSEYFVFMDARTSQMDTTSLVGIPNMTKTDLLENIPYSWVVYFTNAAAAGVLFFDELNLAPSIVQSITYSAIHDRVISDRRISDKVYIFAAGNRSQDKAHTFDMPLPLRDRFAECEVEIDVDAWINWAARSNINSHLISFINWKPANLYNADKVKAEKPSTPRGVARASNLLGDMDIGSNHAHMMASISCGESFATEFQAYCKVYKQLDWPAIFANPASVNSMILDKQYAISAGLADQFKRHPDDVKLHDKIFTVADNLREDFAVFSYRMISNANRSVWKKSLTALNRQKAFAGKYAKYLLDNLT
jgi:hypothetical protein